MSILADWEIRELCVGPGVKGEPPYNPDKEEQKAWEDLPMPMISPYDYGEKRPGIISFGESSYGYDLRFGTKFKVFTNRRGGVVDPKKFNPEFLYDLDAENGDEILLPPDCYALAESVESFHMPADVIGVVLGKSTLARCAIQINCTPIEPGWRGKLTIEVHSACPLPVILYSGEGACQVLFFRGKQCDRRYGQRSQTYQDQTGLTLARVAT